MVVVAVIKIRKRNGRHFTPGAVTRLDCHLIEFSFLLPGLRTVFQSDTTRSDHAYRLQDTCIWTGVSFGSS